MYRKGFTLVELSIVILIIGLLIAGVTVGTTLARQAELRSIMGDLRNYQVAYNNFKSRFDKAPGDLPTASVFWPSTTIGDPKSCGTTAANCNGNGDGLIRAGQTTATHEINKAWKHLELAEMIPYTVDQLNAQGRLTIVGQNTPVAKRTGAGFFMSGGGDPKAWISGLAGDYHPWSGTVVDVNVDGPTINAIFIGTNSFSWDLNETPIGAILTADEAYQIDSKMDDARITAAGGFTGRTTGSIRSPSGGTEYEWIAADGGQTGRCENLASTNDYFVSNTTRACMLGMALE